jgi:hypothetical protein
MKENIVCLAVLVNRKGNLSSLLGYDICQEHGAFPLVTSLYLQQIYLDRFIINKENSACHLCTNFHTIQHIHFK